MGNGKSSPALRKVEPDELAPECLAETEHAYLRELLETLRHAQSAADQYSAFLSRRYSLTQRDRINMDTGEIMRNVAVDENVSPVEEKSEA